MKRTIPLLITALGGFVLIVASFIPETEDWGEVATIWFDLLAAIAFILGGGSLLKTHLKKISDQVAGWGFSAVTIVAFAVTLYVGLAKTGSHPAPKQEYFGETFAELPLSAFPESQVTRIEGKIPKKADGAKLHASVRRQMSEEDGKIVFRGWMQPDQKNELIGFQDELEWQCTVEKLFKQAQPPEPLANNIAYYTDHGKLAFRGPVDDPQKNLLLSMSENTEWRGAVDRIVEQSRRETKISVEKIPETFEVPASLKEIVTYDAQASQLGIKGPMSTAQRDQLAKQVTTPARPLHEDRRDAFRKQLEERGTTLNDAQAKAFNKFLDGSWTASQLRNILDEAGNPEEKKKTACEMLEEKKAGVREINPKKLVGEEVRLNEAQVASLEAFADDEKITVEELTTQLRAGGTFEDRQQGALSGFLSRAQNVGERNRALYLVLLRAGDLSQEQRDFLLDDYRTQYAWRQKVGELFVAAHVIKYPWSGNYSEQGISFWWLYEYAFKPLTATMFAMLAFYVASAAFRAFRAKNVEAILLLGTAFIILLGRTFAGVLLTSWMPESIAGLRIENLTVYIMSVFNTAGNRAIMIGIALGIASTSLKVLLGVDRSYLGSQEE